MIHSNTWNHLTVCQNDWDQACLKMLPRKFDTNHLYLISIYTQDLALNNQQWLICNKTKPNQTKPNQITKRWIKIINIYLYLRLFIIMTNKASSKNKLKLLIYVLRLLIIMTDSASSIKLVCFD